MPQTSSATSGLLLEDSVHPQKGLVSCAGTGEMGGTIMSTLPGEEGTSTAAKLCNTRGFQISHLNAAGYCEFWILLGFDSILFYPNLFYHFYLFCIATRPMRAPKWSFWMTSWKPMQINNDVLQDINCKLGFPGKL